VPYGLLPLVVRPPLFPLLVFPCRLVADALLRMVSIDLLLLLQVCLVSSCGSFA
jgi:hypothetical protein